MENQKPIIGLLATLCVILVVGLSVVFYQQNKLMQSNQASQQALTQAQNQLTARVNNLEQTQPAVSSPDTANLAGASSPASGVAEPVPAPIPASSRTSLDNTWDLYTNNTLGFSIEVPKQNMWTTKKYEAVEILESGDIVYLTDKSSYYYQKIISNIASSKTDLQKVYGITWGILVRTVNSDKELEDLIKAKYGSSCTLGTMTVVAGDPGTYNVAINGDGLGLDKTNCDINFVKAIRYSPTLKKVAIWDLGQAVTFMLNPTTQADTIMSGSFKFIK